jgi:hypothetical protein
MKPKLGDYISSQPETVPLRLSLQVSVLKLEGIRRSAGFDFRDT